MAVFKRPRETNDDVQPKTSPKEDIQAAEKAIDRADRWLAEVMKDADRVFRPSRKNLRGSAQR